MVPCSTSQNDCSMPSLLCGRTYDVKVIAVADHCNSSVPGVTQIQTGERVRTMQLFQMPQMPLGFFDAFQASFAFHLFPYDFDSNLLNSIAMCPNVVKGQND